MSLADCIQTDVVTASPKDSVCDIAELMERRNVGSVVITRDDCPIGIVTDRDLVIRVTARGKDPRLTNAGDIMTRDPVTVREDLGIFDMVNCARDSGIRRIPVVDSDRKLVGILAMDDVVSLLAEQMNCVTDIIKSSAPSAK
jgi:CBS domain-containing protein